MQASELEHGAYYLGRCRNATLARWNAEIQRFVHWRTKFGHRFIETIPNSDIEGYPYDVFEVSSKVVAPIIPEDVIPL